MLTTDTGRLVEDLAFEQIARWFTPGGPIYQRLAPRPERKPRSEA